MRRHTRTQFFLALSLFAGIAFSSSMAAASESRMNSLSNNPMVQDMTDVADFPGLLPMYTNSGFVTVKPTVPDGNTGVFVGDKIIIGAWILREPRFNDIETTEAVFDFDNSLNITLPQTYNIADVFLGLRNGFGIRASVGAGLESVDDLDGATESSGSSAFLVEVVPGFTMQRGRYQGDFGFGVSLSHYRISIGGDSVYTGGNVPSVLLRHRSTLGNFTEPLNWVMDLLVTRRAYTQRHTPTDDSAWVSDWLSSIVLGPRFNLPANFTVNTGLKGQFDTRGGKLEGDKTPRRFGIAAPGIVLSAELYIREVFAIRAGVDYSVYWGTTRIYDTDNEAVGRVRVMGQYFNWSAGIGFKLGSFEIDGTLSQQLILDGPDMVGGTAPGFLGMLSAGYSWQ